MGFMSFFGKKKDDEHKTDLSTLGDGVSLSANADRLSRYSDAGKELQVGLTGVDNSTGQVLKKSLLDISEYNVNPEYADANIKQQAGFSAEVLDTAKRNAEAAKNGENIRYTRVDDIPGRPVNETAYDVTAIDMSTGLEIPDAAAQMKFIKSTPKELAETLTGKEFSQKYPHGTYMVAKDDYSEVITHLVDHEHDLTSKLNNAIERGDFEKAERFSQELEYTQKVRYNLKQSTVTREEAINARLHPRMTIAKETFKIGHEVGTQCALTCGGITGALSLLSNANKVLNNEITAEEAAVNVGKDTAIAAGKGYIVGQANTFLASALKNSSNDLLKALGKTNAPAYIISMSASVFSSLTKYAEGEITTEECFDRIARSGFGLAGSSAVGAAAGAAFGPVGLLVGSLIGGMVTDRMYTETSDIIKAPYYAKQERLLIEAQCNETIAYLIQYRSEIERLSQEYFAEYTECFKTALDTIGSSLIVGDADGVIAGANMVTEKLNGQVQYKNMAEFDAFMNDDKVDFIL